MARGDKGDDLLPRGHMTWGSPFFISQVNVFRNSIRPRATRDQMCRFNVFVIDVTLAVSMHSN
jgi:hypothetical protein